MKKDGISIFYSYSHKDETFREALETHLSILARKNIISEWHDRKITAGQEWKKEIDEELRTADILLLLISSDFIASDYCYEKELKVALERHESNQAIVIPVIVRPSEWSDAPFAKLQALPKDAKAVTSWDNQDEAWLDVVEGIKKAINEIHSLKNRRKATTGFLSIKDLLVREIDNIEAAFEVSDDQITVRGLPTGLDDLDSMTDGLHKSELVVIASRPGMGKTDLAIQIAANTAIDQGKSVAYFSLNLPADRITRKLIASLGRIDAHNIFRGKLIDEEWPRLTSAVSISAGIPLYIEDTISLSIDAIRQKAISIKKDKSVELIVIDSLQHLALEESKDNSVGGIHCITKELSKLARELMIPIVVTTMVSQEVERRTNKRPLIIDLGEWRSLEEDADTILFLHREEVYNYDSNEKGVAEIIVAKNASDGPVGTVRVQYFGQYCRFQQRTEFDGTNEI